MKGKGLAYAVNLPFEEISLLLLRDTLILEKKIKHATIGILKSFEQLAKEYGIVETDLDNVESVFVNKKTLMKTKTSGKRIFTTLGEKVFYYISDRELMKVNYGVFVWYNNSEQYF